MCVCLYIIKRLQRVGKSELTRKNKNNSKHAFCVFEVRKSRKSRSNQSSIWAKSWTRSTTDLFVLNGGRETLGNSRFTQVINLSRARRSIAALCRSFKRRVREEIYFEKKKTGNGIRWAENRVNDDAPLFVFHVVVRRWRRTVRRTHTRNYSNRSRSRPYSSNTRPNDFFIDTNRNPFVCHIRTSYFAHTNDQQRLSKTNSNPQTDHHHHHRRLSVPMHYEYSIL